MLPEISLSKVSLKGMDYFAAKIKSKCLVWRPFSKIFLELIRIKSPQIPATF